MPTPNHSAAARGPATFDFYRPIHKGLRLALSDLLVRIGWTDFSDAGAAKSVLADLRAQLVLSASHLKHEEDFIHRAIEERAPGAVANLERQHDAHDRDFAALENLIAAAEAADDAERPYVGRQLYLRFSHFVAEDLEHMAAEEETTLPFIQSLFTDDELMDIDRRLVASVPPEKMMAYLRIMLPAMNRPERRTFLSIVQAAAPAEAFTAILEHVAKPALPAEDWADLRQTFALAA